MASRIYSVEGHPVIQVVGDNGPLYFTVTSVESFAGELGCEDDWVAVGHLQPVHVVPVIPVKL